MKWFLFFIAFLLVGTIDGKPPSDQGRLLTVLAGVFLVGGCVIHALEKPKDKR